MDYAMYASLLIITLGTSVITLFTGFGVGTILMPVMSLFFDIKVAILLAAIVHFCNNASRLLLYRQAIDRQILRRFGLLSIAGAFVGSYVQLSLDGAFLKSGVGCFLVVYALLSLSPQMPQVELPAKLDALGGFLSGLLGGLIGNQGAIRSLYLLKYHLPKESMIASAACIALLIDATRIPFYLYGNKAILQEQALLLVLIIAASIGGTLIGGQLLPKVSYYLFKNIILVAILLLGVGMIFGIL